MRNTRKRPCGKLANDSVSVPLFQNQLVTSSKKIASRRPIMSVWIVCNCLELVGAAFSSTLDIISSAWNMETTGNQDNSPVFESRPWGSFTVLDETDNYNVNR